MASCKIVRLLLAAALLAAASACTTGFENTPLDRGQSNPERRSLVNGASDRPVILMAFSGGGARAAALAAAVLAQMKAVSYTASDGRHQLTDDVSFISSVSGGSVTAAWFGLYRAERLDDLQARFLSLNNMATIEDNLINPVFWAREAFTPYSRIDALESLLDKRLFDGRHISDINQPGHPFVVFNASDMAGGESFAFTASRFDDLCSHYDGLKLSTAVAASAAFPIALTPVTLKDFQPNCAGDIRSAHWAQVEQGENQEQIQSNVPEYRNARYTNDLRHGPNVFRQIDYVHLLDGGLADNLGLMSIRDALARPSDDTQLLRQINEGQIRKVVVIAVNARSDSPNPLYQKENASGLVSQFNAVTSVPIDANSQSTQSNIDNLLTELARASAQMANSDVALQVYNVSVDFDTIAADTPEHRALRDAVKAIPTSWNITAPQLATIHDAAVLIVANDACFHQLLVDLKASPAPPAGYAAQCRTNIAKR